MLGTLVRLAVSMATVLTHMFIHARYLNRRQGGGLRVGAGPRRRKTPLLEVVTRQGLSRTASLAVVRVSGQLLLLGVTDSAVSVLREVDEETDEIETIEIDGLDEAGSGSVTPLRPTGRDVAGSVVEALRERTVRRG